MSLLIQKQSGTNTVDVVDRVLARLESIKRTLPSDIRVQPIRDQSRFIRRSFEDIKLHLILGALLASLVVFLFIRNMQVTLIAALAIPTSIIGTFTVMKAFGFTLNNMTMLALSLATGIVIDDAIVVLENIFRYVEEKDVTPHEAAIKATEEIGLAVMATTLSLVRHLPAGRVHDRAGGTVLLQLRHHVGGRDPDLDARVVHADADAVLAVAEDVGRVHDTGRRRNRGASTRGSTRGTAACSTGRSRTAGDGRHRGGRRAVARCCSTRTSARSLCPTTTRASSAST